MPIQGIVNAATPVEGSLPGSPIAGSFSNMLNAYAGNIPNQTERARMALEGSQTDLNKQKLGAPKNLGDVFTKAYGAVPAGSVNSDGTPMTHDQWIQSQVPGVIQAAGEAGDLGQAANLFRLAALNNPTGYSKNSQALAIQGAGEPYTASQKGAEYTQNAETGRALAVVRAEHQYGTPEQRNRESNIQNIMKDQGATRQQASAIVDHVIEGGLDPVTRQPYVLNKLDLMNGKGTTPSAVPATPAAAGAAPPLGTPGGEVPITRAAPAPGATPAPGAADFPVATAADINIDTNKAYGGASAVGKLGSMYDAVTGTNTPGGASAELAKANAFKSGYLAIVGQHPGFRNNATAQGLNLNQLPDTGPVTDLEDIGKQALVKPTDAATAFTAAMNRVIEMRKSDSAIVGNGGLPPEERISAQNRIRDEDNFLRQHGSPALVAQYSAAAGIPAPTPAAPSNQDTMKAATTVINKVPTRAEGAAMPVGSTFSDAKGTIWQKAADGSFQRAK